MSNAQFCMCVYVFYENFLFLSISNSFCRGAIVFYELLFPTHFSFTEIPLTIIKELEGQKVSVNLWCKKAAIVSLFLSLC